MARKTEFEIKTKLAEFGFKEPEILEVKKDVYQMTDYPQSHRTFRIEYEAENYNVEEMYYWIVGHLHYDFGHHDVIKIVDTHAHSAGSALFGDLQARLGAQQSNVSNYMGMMGRLIKDLFGLVRELRQLEERLGYYADTKSLDDAKKANAAESTLKDIWITLVEGGSQNPSSVYGMAQKVGFTVLPDLFFAAGPLNRDMIDEHVNRLDFNESVKKALGRKLFQFTVWKEETHKELINKRNFQIRYLRQHYEVIQMYMEWIKPYIRNIQRLNLNEEKMENDAFLIHAFDTSVSEVETALCKRIKSEKSKKKDEKSGEEIEYVDHSKSQYGVILINFTFHTKPQILIRAPESYQQKGAVHTGRVDMIMRVYGWTGAMIDKYKAYRDSQAWDFIQSFDQSIKDAMEYLGEDLRKYMEEAGKSLPPLTPKTEDKKNDKKKKTDEPNQFKETMSFLGGPFNGIIELFNPILGLDNLFGMFKSDPAAKDKEKAKEVSNELKKIADDTSRVPAYQAIKNYKKAHKLTHW